MGDGNDSSVGTERTQNSVNDPYWLWGLGALPERWVLSCVSLRLIKFKYWNKYYHSPKPDIFSAANSVSQLSPPYYRAIRSFEILVRTYHEPLLYQIIIEREMVQKWAQIFCIPYNAFSLRRLFFGGASETLCFENRIIEVVLVPGHFGLKGMWTSLFLVLCVLIICLYANVKGGNMASWICLMKRECYPLVNMVLAMKLIGFDSWPFVAAGIVVVHKFIFWLLPLFEKVFYVGQKMVQGFWYQGELRPTYPLKNLWLPPVGELRCGFRVALQTV